MSNVESVETYGRNKLRGRIIERYKTQTRFAAEIGISKNALSQKMTGKMGMDQRDIALWCKLLDINIDEIGEFFFT